MLYDIWQMTKDEWRMPEWTQNGRKMDVQNRRTKWTNKWIIKISWFLNGSSSFSTKISEKKLNFCFLLKKSVKEITWIRIHFFQCGSRIRIRNRIKIKWILSSVESDIPFINDESLEITVTAPFRQTTVKFNLSN